MGRINLVFQDALHEHQAELEQQIRAFEQRLDGMEEFAKQRISDFHAEIAAQNNNISKHGLQRISFVT